MWRNETYDYIKRSIQNKMKRRTFGKMLGTGVLATQAFPLTSAALSTGPEASDSSRVPLGLCNHALRGKKLNARQLIEYAIEHKLDSVQFNT